MGVVPLRTCHRSFVVRVLGLGGVVSPEVADEFEGGVVVVVLAGAVVAAGGAGVGVAGGVLDVLEGCAGGESLGDEGMAEAVGGDLVGRG